MYTSNFVTVGTCIIIIIVVVVVLQKHNAEQKARQGSGMLQRKLAPLQSEQKNSQFF
jgi:hypothetical protein